MSYRFDPAVPFRILKAVRDRELTAIPPAIKYTSPPGYDATRNLLKRLVEQGFLLVDERSELSIDPKLPELFKALRVSLTDLSGYGPGSIVCNPRFRPSRRAGAYPNVFVLMPFREELRSVYDDHIAPVATTKGLTCARADDLFGAESIVSEVWSCIRNAKIVIADCTGRNPNVFYEIGMAHTVGVPVILLSQSIDDVPLDLRHERVIVYAYTPQGVRAFERALSEAIDFEGRTIHRNVLGDYDY